ncbi:hypothetical protein C0Q70_15409 [Pomacea canaliculata]|uniref:C3H1-type domain-containing protein n=1 Tax=Pomacea canaliculata TaxID=400727 RepID=A0A2T7NUU8_POMCA|nr:hypothetical protein C0Q70_15409 [Pomacea canaliculata]
MSLSSPSVKVWVLLVVVSVTRGQTVTPPCTTLNQVMSHPTDCRRYIECVNGQPSDRPCPPECMPKMCSSALVAHPSKCHQYYNCTGGSTLIRYYRPNDREVEEDYLYECPYPELFSEVTSRCEDYRDVQCGQRFLPLGKCEYTKNQCQFSHCTPCEFYSPSCRGLADGMNVHSLRMWSPDFAVCKDQRLVNTSTCPGDRVSSRRLFSPVLGRCANLYEVPVEYGGYFLNCTGRADGLYLDDVTNRPDLYFRCTSGDQMMSPSVCQPDNEELPIY